MKKLNIFLAILVIAIVTLINSVFTVDQRQYAIVFQFGEAIKVYDEAGLKFKIPLIQEVQYFDNRVLNVDIEEREIIASDQKRIIVNAYAKYKITNPVKFYKTVGSYGAVDSRIKTILESALRKTIGEVPLISLLSVERTNIMTNIKNSANNEASRFGVDVIDVRILRADLPPENSAAIYKRMQTERFKEAKEIRAEGAEEAQRITSKADREREVILAKAYKKAEIIRGEGDAKAASIYNKAFSKDRNFYNFLRSLDTYKNSFSAEDTSFVLSPGNNYLKHLKLNK